VFERRGFHGIFRSKGIEKSFGTVKVLKKIDFSLKKER